MALPHVQSTATQSRSYTYQNLLTYFFPELITASILYFIVHFVDAHWVSGLEHTQAYATLEVTNTLFHFLTKLAEGIAVGVIVICGRYNSQKEYENVGRAAIDAFWTTCAVGALIGMSVFYGAPYIYQFFGVNKEMVTLGVPFIKLRAWSIFFTFVFFAFVGFLRAIKNTAVTMYLFLLGSGIFLFFDYVFIFGKYGFSCMAFQGSALAAVIQYAAMSILALAYILLNSQTRKYGIKLFSAINFRHVWQLMSLSLPVMLDKATFALCGIWTAKCVGALCIGGLDQSNLVSALGGLKQLERFILLPALASAQIATFMVSNAYASSSFDQLAESIKKIVVIAGSMVCLALLFVMLKPHLLLSLLDAKQQFSQTIVRVIPFLGIIIFFDVTQLLFSAMLRGAGSVQTVMWTRIIISLLVFVPLTLVPFIWIIDSVFMQFMMVVLALTISNATMACIYIYKIWQITKQQKIPNR